jgi:hypothetical protein
MDLASFGNTLDIVAQRDSFARRRHSNALPMIVCGNVKPAAEQSRAEPGIQAERRGRIAILEAGAAGGAR